MCNADHHLPEIKRRALDSLCFKLYNNLLTPSDFRVRVLTYIDMTHLAKQL